MFAGVGILLLYLRLSLSVTVAVQPIFVLFVAISSVLYSLTATLGTEESGHCREVAVEERF